jgi:hypothetical protein
MAHFLVERVFDDPGRARQTDDEIPLAASTLEEAITQARFHGLKTEPAPAYCKLYLVSGVDRATLWDSRQEQRFLDAAS